MKNNRSIKFTALMCLLFGGFTVAGLSALSSISGKGTNVLVNAKNAPLVKRAINPDEYEEVSSAKLLPQITNYTGTSLSRHLDVKFTSQAVNAYRGRRSDVFSVISDTNYSGKDDDPFINPQDDNYLDGFVYQAKVSNSSLDTIYIPYEVTYGGKGARARFIIQNKYVESHCMDSAESYDNGTKAISYIYIFDGIDEIKSNAFINVPDTVTIKCQAAAKPEGWADDWTDATNILWGQDPVDSTDKDMSAEGSLSMAGYATLGTAEDFILGYKGKTLEDGEVIPAYPLTIGYDVIKDGGARETRYQELPTKHLTNPYDAVGSTIYGPENAFEITINVEEGETIDEESYVFYNIFEVKRVYTNVKDAWDSDSLKKMYEKYEGMEFRFPVLEGNDFSNQLYETDEDSYITIFADKDNEDNALALVNEYKDEIEAAEFKSMDKADYGEEEYPFGDKSYAKDNYGYVYRKDFEENGKKYAAVAQFYQFEDHFVSYLFIDELEEKVTEDEEKGQVTTYELRNLPIEEKKEAVRPFYFAPDLSKGKFLSNAVGRYRRMINISDIFTFEYNSSSSFAGYTSISMKLDKLYTTAYYGHLASDETKGQIFLLNDEGKYYIDKTVYADEDVIIDRAFRAPEVYIQDNSTRNIVVNNIEKIIDGSINFRYTFANLNKASLMVKYKKGGQIAETEIPIVSPSPVVEIAGEKDNDISFLVENAKLSRINSKDIVSFGVSGITVNIHLFNAAVHSVVQNSSLLNVFGNIEVFPYNENGLKYFDINLYLVLFFVGLTVIYAVIAVILFFVLKNKYKNDEFRRIRPKQYLKSALLGFLGLGLIAGMLNFIILRFGVFMSSVPVSNPIDPFVILFGIAGAIAIGFFIKNLIVYIKLEKKRKETERLHLDKDVAEDGTN